MSRTYRSHIDSLDVITVIYTEGLPVAFTADHPAFRTLKALIKSGQYNKIGAAATAADRIKLHDKTDAFYVKDGVVILKGTDEELPAALSKTLIAFADAGAPYEPLLKFWERLKENPSEDSRSDLYAFLEHNSVPITEDGRFVAYKRVRSNFMDKHSGTFDNSVGKVVSMPREDVDPDRNQTCSRGLHVAAFEYAQGFGYGDDKLLEVEVDPVDVVAVPTDYNNQKMRTCRYTVLRVIEREYDTTENPVYQPDSQLVDEGDFNEDVYDEDIYDQDDLDDWNGNAGIDDDLDDLDDVEESVQVGDSVVLTATEDGRFVIPRGIVSGAGLDRTTGNGKKTIVGAFKVGDKLVIAGTVDEANAVHLNSYQVDGRGNIRIAKKVLSRVGLDNRNTLTVAVESLDGELRIVVSK